MLDLEVQTVRHQPLAAPQVVRIRQVVARGLISDAPHGRMASVTLDLTVDIVGRQIGVDDHDRWERVPIHDLLDGTRLVVRVGGTERRLDVHGGLDADPAGVRPEVLHREAALER